MKFEYKVITFDVKGLFCKRRIDCKEAEEQLNRYGLDGWELIKLVDLKGDFGKSSTLVATLKRPL